MDQTTLLITGGAGYVSSVLADLIEHSSSGSTSTSTNQNLNSRFVADSKRKLHSDLHETEKPLLPLSVNRILLVDRVAPSLPADLITRVPVEVYQVDLTNYEELCSVFELESVDAICHLASYGMSGREQLHKEVIWEVNVGGTNNIIKACKKYNVRSLVFTSTVNVVFGGQKIEDGDESLPYFDPDMRKWDNYGNSKTLAEQSVLQANLSMCADGETYLRTAVLRLPGIYGPNERRHIPRVVGLMKAGLFKVTYGDNPVVEFIHVSNVCNGLLLATKNLLQNSSSAAGKAYFLSDGAPINNFEFFRPLTEALDVPFPSISLPMWLIYFIATVIEWVYGLVHNWVDFQPLLCRAEVYKTAQTHYFSIEKARKELGYQPLYQNDMITVANQYRENTTSNTRAQTSPKPYSVRTLFLLSVFVAVLSVFIYSTCL